MRPGRRCRERRGSRQREKLFYERRVGTGPCRPKAWRLCVRRVGRGVGWEFFGRARLRVCVKKNENGWEWLGVC